MPKKILKFCGRASFFSLKVVSVLLILCALVAAVLLWQVSQKPLDLGFAKEAIEAALHDSETGNAVKMERVVLFWPKLDGPLLLGLEGAKLVGPKGDVILSVNEAAFSFSRSALLMGRILPKTIILKKPSLRLRRGEDNTIDIGFGGFGPAKTEANAESGHIMTRILGYLARPGHEAARRSIISRLEAFEIEDAQLMIEDHALGMTWYLPHFSAGFFSVQSGLRTNFDITLPEVNGRPSTIALNLNYIWDTKKSRIAAEIKNLDTMILAGKLPELEIFRDQNIILDAHMDAALDENFLVQALQFNLNSPKGEIFHAALSDYPVPYENLKASALYDTASKTLIVDNTNVTLRGVTMHASGDFKQESGKISGPVKLRIDDAAQELIGPLWPKVLRGDNSEQWIVHKMSGGRFQAVSLSLDLEALHDAATGWRVQTNNIMAAFGFKDMDLNYRPPLFPVRGSTGSGTFDMNKDEMRITIDSAKIGDIPVQSASLVFDRLVEHGVGDVDITAKMSGPLQAMMKYIAEEPIHANKETNMDLDAVKGSAEMTVNMRFPAIKDVHLKDFKINADGILRDVFFPNVVKTLDLSGGPFAVNVKDGLFTLKGQGSVDNRPINLTYQEYLQSEGKPFKSKIEAEITADPNIRSVLGIDLSSFLEGSVPVKLSYTTQRDKTAQAKVQADITPAIFFVDPFDFEKSAGESGSANFSAHFKNKEIQYISDLNAQGEGFSLEDTRIDFIHTKDEVLLSGGKIPRFTLGDTKGKIDFEIDKNRVVKLMMANSFLDARPFLDAEEIPQDYAQMPMMISVSASSMRTAPAETIRAAEIFIDMDARGRFNQMEMDAIAGASAVYLRYSPDESGKRTFRLKTEDAGAVLRSFQIYSNIRGGKMVIYGEPVSGTLDRNLIGKAQITDFKAVKAPILTKLLSLISVPGLLETLSGDGLNFSKLEADFNWLYRKEGSVLVLKDGRTSGNSLGLTFDGTFDNAQRQIDVKGTVVPMSEVNNLLGSIPLVGDILTGGSGGIFAATYSITGSSDDPKIGLNPLSVLAPGILRRILFE